MSTQFLATQSDGKHFEPAATPTLATSAPASRMAPSPISWLALPTLAPQAHRNLHADLIENLRHFDAPLRKAVGTWLLHMIDLKLTTAHAVARAFSNPHPFTALHRLYADTRNRLARHLNHIVEQQSPDSGTHWKNVLHVSLGGTREDDTPTVLLEMSYPHGISLDSLHNVRSRLAALVHESLSLIHHCLFHYMLPRELWSADMVWYIEEGMDEYKLLRAAGGLRNVPAMLALVQQENFNHFSDDPDHLREQYLIYQQMAHGPPRWMRSLRGKRPILRARQLKRAAAQYAFEFGSHPWADYVTQVSDAVCARFAGNDELLRFQKLCHRQYQPLEDADVPIGQGMYVHSGSKCEIRNAEAMHEGFGQNGESLTEPYRLNRLATSHLAQILETFAIGIGLLLRAEAVDELSRKPAR